MDVCEVQRALTSTGVEQVLDKLPEWTRPTERGRGYRAVPVLVAARVCPPEQVFAWALPVVGTTGHHGIERGDSVHTRWMATRQPVCEVQRVLTSMGVEHDVLFSGGCAPHTPVGACSPSGVSGKRHSGGGGTGR
jgi:hypothetical protein